MQALLLALALHQSPLVLPAQNPPRLHYQYEAYGSEHRRGGALGSAPRYLYRGETQAPLGRHPVRPWGDYYQRERRPSGRYLYRANPY